LRMAADLGLADSCLRLTRAIYLDHPYGREIGHVGEAAGSATSAGVMRGRAVQVDSIKRRVESAYAYGFSV